MGWLRVADATVTGSGVSSLPNVIGGGSPAVQTSDAKRPTIGTTSNGLPIMQFNGSQCLLDPLQAAINDNIAFLTVALWLRAPLGTTVRTIYAARGIGGGASAHRVRWAIQANEAVMLDVFLDNSNFRRVGTSTPQALGGWEFWSGEIDCSLVGDARGIQRRNGVDPGSTYSAGGIAAEMPATLVTPTGDAIIGGVDTIPSQGFIGDTRDIFFYARQFTSPELVNLMAFEQPVG